MILIILNGQNFRPTEKIDAIKNNNCSSPKNTNMSNLKKSSLQKPKSKTTSIEDQTNRKPISNKEILNQLTKTTEKPKEKENWRIKNQGKMELKGSLRGTSYSGIDIAELRGATSYYIKTGMTEKALVAAAECYRMQELESLNDKYEKPFSASAVVTQIYNELASICSKCISIDNISLVTAGYALITSENRNFDEFIALVHLMCNSYKTYLIHYLRYAYMDNDGRVKAASQGVYLPDIEDLKKKEIRELEEDEFYKFLDKRGSLIKGDEEESGESQYLKLALCAFRKAVKDLSLSKAFNWIYHIYEYIITSIKTGPKTKETTKEMDLPFKVKVDIDDFSNRKIGKETTHFSILIWKALEDLLPTKFYGYSVNFYYNNTIKNRDYYLYTAILTAVYQPQFTPLDLSSYIKETGYENKNLLNGKYQIDISDYKEYITTIKSIKKTGKANWRIEENTELFPITEILDAEELLIRDVFNEQEESK